MTWTRQFEVRNRYRIQARDDKAYSTTFEISTKADSGQRRVVALLGEIGLLSWSAP